MAPGERMAANKTTVPVRLFQGIAEAAALGNLRYAEELARQVATLDEDQGNELREALQVVRQGLRAVERRPKDPHAHLLLARGYFFADAGDAGLQEANEALRLDPSVGEAAVMIGLEYCYRGELEPARSAYQRARTVLSPSNQWLIGLGVTIRSSETALHDPANAVPVANPWMQLRKKITDSGRLLGALASRKISR